MDWEKYAFATRTKQRRNILKTLERPYSPTAISKAISARANHITRNLKLMEKEDIVYCTNPEKRKPRLYDLTDEGRKILDQYEKTSK